MIKQIAIGHGKGVVKLSSCPAMLLTNFARALLSRQKLNVDPNGIIIGSSSVRPNLKSL